MDNVFIAKLISTAILIVLIFGLRALIVRKLLERETLTTRFRRRWMVVTRNAALLLVLTCLVVIWFEQLRAIAATAVVIAVAIVIATKELLLNIVGFLSPSGAHFFSIGDRIEVGEVRGDVIDQTMMGTTILEIGNGAKTHQYTGEAIFIPNSIFLTATVKNETHIADYVFHAITVPLKADGDWQHAEQALLSAANAVCAPYLEKARDQMTELTSKHSLDTPTADPRVHIKMPEPERIDLVVRVPIPAMRRGRIEQEIMRRYLLKLEELRRAGEERREPIGEAIKTA